VIALEGTAFHYCWLSGIPLAYNYAIFSILAFDMLLTGLASYECYKHIRDVTGTSPWCRKSIITLILRDSVVYFLMYASRDLDPVF
jgi:hypothetical protein